MIGGIIFKNMACIEYSLGKHHFLTDWSQFYEGKEVSKKCCVASEEYFYKKVLEIIQLEIKQIPVGKIILTFPRVSVILPVYQGEKTVRAAIRSILKQTYQNIELIIVNDGSTDGTEEIISKMIKKYSQIKYIKNGENRGVYFSRNIGIKESTGDFITIQDADDISTSLRIEKSVGAITSGGFEFILANGQYIHEFGGHVCPVRVTMATFMCGKDFFVKYGMYDENTRHSGDLELLDRAYFKKYGEYKFDNFWYWLNYTPCDGNFYGHIYENLYYIGLDGGDRITKKNNIRKRLKYLNQRRKEFKNM
jgi:glycosyltransferase involved in cell wall biosynthesis